MLHVNLMSHPLTFIKYCVNVSNKINFDRYQRTERVKSQSL